MPLRSPPLPPPQEVFRQCLVDGRMLEHLKKKDLRNSLQMLESSHRSSLHFGIVVLTKVGYSRQKLEERRRRIVIEQHRSSGEGGGGSGPLKL